MRDFEGKTAVVTGSASGMGLAFARCLGREGMNVVMCDIEEKALRVAAAEVESLGATVLPVVTDVSDEASMDHLGEATRGAFGSAHLLCLNAGVSPPTGPMETLTANDWRWTLGVNLWGVIHGIRVFLPELKAQNEGHVVVTASVAGLTSSRSASDPVTRSSACCARSGRNPTSRSARRKIWIIRKSVP